MSVTRDPRYPIGPFEAPGALDKSAREGAFEQLSALPRELRAAVDGLADDQLDTPYRDGGWTVRQVVHHVVDSHVNAYIRFKLAVTEDHPRITTYMQDAWANLPDARDAPVESSLAILDAFHARWVSFLRALPAEAFGRTLSHPEMGEITVDELLEVYRWHCPHHEGHITALRERTGW